MIGEAGAARQARRVGTYGSEIELVFQFQSAKKN